MPIRIAFALSLFPVLLAAQSQPVYQTPYQLTARPWKPLDTPKSHYLDLIEGVCRYSIRLQSEDGAIIDPFIHREHQYATPYFAYAAITLVHAGRAADLLPHAIKAMDHATRSFAGGNETIPDAHGNFFIAALTGALDLFKGHAANEQISTWRDRLRVPRHLVQAPNFNNWETYVMKGEWMREQAGLAGRAETIAAIEEAWNQRQRQRIAASPWWLYHDRTSDPDTLSVEAVGRGNLLALTHLGYNGPSAAAIRSAAEDGTRFTLLLQDPTGQTPANGRTDDHVWVDVGYQLAFEVMAERSRKDAGLAGQYRRAALLALDNISRWRRSGGIWDGSFFVTKNHFDPTLRVGYQPASQYTNYNGSLMFHLAEAYHARASEIAERPAPSEVGGYAFELDNEFSSAFANAGGMQIQVNLRGQTGITHANRWTPLGLVRFSRTGWDSRLGPSDGALPPEGSGVSFAPAFMENGVWIDLASLPDRYEGRWTVGFAHPLLVRCLVQYRPKTGQSGPTFEHHFTITPDGVLAELRKTSPDDSPWAVTWPVLIDDGRPLSPSVAGPIASTGYSTTGDRQNFISLNAAQPQLISGGPVRSTYGDLRPVRATSGDAVNRTFIYPSGPGDPAAESVLASFRVTENGFHSSLGRIEGTLYTGRTSAGGVGRTIDLDNDGKPDASFDAECGFILQLKDGRIVAVETDRAVTGLIQGRRILFKPHSPVQIPQSRSGAARN